MPTEGTLLLELSRIQGQRLGKELQTKRDIFNEVGFVDDENYWVKIIEDNWDTDNEVNERYFMSGN